MDEQKAVEERAASVQEFLTDVEDYSKKDVILRFKPTDGYWATYSDLPPDKWKRKTPMIGKGKRSSTKVFLCTAYFLFITKWTDNSKGRLDSLKVFGTTFSTGLVKEIVSDKTWGVSDLVMGVGGKFLTSRNFLGKNPTEVLMNPWSQLIPLKAITNVELITFGFMGKKKAMRVTAEVSYVGPIDLYFQIGKNTKKWSEKLKESVDLLP